jgi:hypothetical protein
MNSETKVLKRNALQFNDEHCFAGVSKASDGSTEETLDMVCYSGGIIKNHWYWGDLVIDISGFSFPKKKMPVLEDHYTSKKIGFATKMSTEGNKLTVAESTFIDTPESLAFRQNSKAGFPYEASWYGIPTVIEEISDGESVEVNGYTFKGPGTIWRKTIFKEASVCTFGYDPNTKSVAMSENDEEITVEIHKFKEETKIPKKEDTNKMNIEQFKAECPEEFAALVASISSDAEKKYSEQIKALTEKNGELNDSNTKLSEEIQGTSKRLLVLEKNETLRQEKEIQFTANGIFDTKFTAAEIAPRLHDKVRKLVNHEQFVKEGQLDTQAFGAAVDEELKDWTKEDEEDTVSGFGFSTKIVEGDGKEKVGEKVRDAAVGRMLKYCGQGADEKE